MKVAVLVGGVGGAQFLLGVKEALGMPAIGEPEQESPHEISAVVNIADDVWMHGLRVCPDLDTCMYTLGGGIDTAKGWGREFETWSVSAELSAYGAEPSWFGLGDRDIATHLVRTRMLRAGYPLSAITEALCDRWRPGVNLLPVTDERVETHVAIEDPQGAGPKAVHFQEWWVRHGAGPEANAIVPVGAEEATALPETLEAISGADVVLLAPSNPVVSIGTVLAVPGVRAALRETAAPVVGLSPIVGGSAVRGMADSCLRAIGVDSTAQAVGQHYGSRSTSNEGILDAWLVDSSDTAQIPGVATRSVPLIMSDVSASAEMARAAFEIGGVAVPEVAG
ncbi:MULTISPECIES: 2-phospho-L-lactate transferase [unclassified Actinopolyspora]|uniref:2-phospho-L-lactate transferase n=1 Tax=unclassified Actinopolyspora TaxID=2639451 RepID=UPI0013F675F3|nr:2-phospho-L-lactate transferase [Actinopolyspora sp. BKK2]NHE78232.1 2-phospho-L-lactate transferase [Actinopolyspora sp. BKK1]